MNCRCGKQLSGGIDTYGVWNEPMCQDCWLETSEERSVQLREQDARQKEAQRVYIEIEATRAEIKGYNDEIESLRNLKRDALKRKEDLEYELAKLDDFYARGMVLP